MQRVIVFTLSIIHVCFVIIKYNSLNITSTHKLNNYQYCKQFHNFLTYFKRIKKTTSIKGQIANTPP